MTGDDLFDFRYKDIKNQLVSCYLQRFELALLENSDNSAEKYLVKACKLEQSLSTNLKEAAIYLLEQGRRLNMVGRKEEAASVFRKAKCFLSAAKIVKPEDKEIEDIMQSLAAPQ